MTITTIRDAIEAAAREAEHIPNQAGFGEDGTLWRSSIAGRIHQLQIEPAPVGDFVEVAPAMINEGMRWLRHWPHMRAQDRDGAVEQAYRAMNAASRQPPAPASDQFAENANCSAAVGEVERLRVAMADLLLTIDAQVRVGIRWDVETVKEARAALAALTGAEK